MGSKKFWLGMAALGALAACAGTGAGDDGAADEGGAGNASGAAVLPGRVASAAELARMERFVADRIDPATVRETLHTVAGRGIDCVDIEEQPAMRALRARGERRATPPTLLDEPAAPSGKRAAQPEPLFAPSGVEATCPNGTVPIAQITLEDLSRFSTLDEYFTKTSTNRALGAIEPPHFGPSALHQYAHAARSVANWGAETSISIAPFYTELTSEFSLGQIWVAGGSGAGLQTLEVGLQHYQDLYHDANPHMFIYSTNGGYAPGTGCYNNTCGDFVQVSSTYFPAMGVGPISTPGGAQYEFNVHWAKAGEAGDWWLSAQGQWVGYYPRSRYSAIANHAQVIDFGGEIIDGRTGGRHTTTDMGTGYAASAGWTWAAFMRLIRYNDSNPSGAGITWAEVSGLTAYQDDAACYSISGPYYGDPGWHTYFWYGGAGYNNPNCL